MCGILGWAGCAQQKPNLEQFCAALVKISHRGPDSGQVWIKDNVFFGHRRLSIIDPHPRSDQPMSIGNFTVTFNGEIYNYKKIAEELRDLGHVFNTNSDTEVILRAWIEWNEDSLTRFEGMYSFGIWDSQNQSLFLARDKFGEKPLFIHQRQSNISFSSEMSPLFLLSKGCFEEDKVALSQYFLNSYIPAPRTIFTNVTQLPPGCWAHWRFGYGLNIRKYFDLNTFFEDEKKEVKGNYSKHTRTLRSLLENSVIQRVEAADVDIASFLSGGIDSSIVTLLAADIMDKPLPAYSISFPQDKAFDEVEYAKLVANSRKNIKHQIIEATENDLLDFAPRVFSKLSEPYADSSLLPTSFLCSHIQEKVALGGDGADELFAGYGVYSALLLNSKLPKWLLFSLSQIPKCKFPKNIRNNLLRSFALFHANLQTDLKESYLCWRRYADPDVIKKLNLDPSFAMKELKYLLPASFTTLDSFREADIANNLPNDMLKKVDYSSMANGLEVRLPFLDSKLVKWAASLPPKFLIDGRQRKKILKDTYKDFVPIEVIHRRKMGFLVPVTNWFAEGRLHDEYIDLSSSQVDFDKTYLNELLSEHVRGVMDHSETLWSLYVYMIWKNTLNEGLRASNSYKLAVENQNDSTQTIYVRDC